MTDLQQIVTDYFNINRNASEMMYESYNKEWNNEGCPFHWRSVDSHGGEGEGTDFYNVVECQLDGSDETVFVKLQGWYASYDGAEYESWRFVKPYLKTITVYE